MYVKIRSSAEVCYLLVCLVGVKINIVTLLRAELC